MVDMAQTRFENCRGVSNGGVLFALPALLANGLLRGIDRYFSVSDGGNYYRLDQIFLVLAFSILLRTKNLDQLQYRPAGEWGRLLGLDRIPEKRTMREKVNRFSADQEKVSGWGLELSEDWLREADCATGVLYVDGHIRVYNGNQTRLPRRYVARQRLCLRGMTDYWLNDGSGLPIFVVTSACTDGLLANLRDEIIPRLLKEIPNLPSEAELEENPFLPRFFIAFDREGYSPGFLKEMWENHRIACVTYHKHPKESWRPDEFEETLVTDKHGNQSRIRLAERGSRIGSKSGEQLWVREIRKLTDGGRQVSLITTNFIQTQAQTFTALRGRWTQENYFKYAMAEFGIDRLAGYELEEIDPNKSVTNPCWRDLDYKIRSLNSKRTNRILKRESICIDEQMTPQQIEDAMADINFIQEEIESLEQDITRLKDKRSAIPKKLPFHQLPEEHKFKQFSQSRHQFISTLRIIAYRSETALANELRDIELTKEARSIIKDIFNTEADLEMDQENQRLTVRLHHLANPRLSRAAKHLADQLNQAEQTFPGTPITVHYSVIGMDENENNGNITESAGS
jgi:hypothetical protein